MQASRDLTEGGDGYIEQMLRARFTASPRGNGANNFRDWEALLAGYAVSHRPERESSSSSSSSSLNPPP